MKRTLYTILILIFVLSGAICILFSNKEQNEQETAIITKKNEAVSIKVDTVKLETPGFIYTGNGTFEAIQQLMVAPETAGTVQKIMVQEGDTVTKGQILAYLKEDQANVIHQNANAIYQNALENYTRYQQAYKTGGVTREQLEHIELALENAKSSLTNADLQMNDTRIRATINGIINKKMVEPGAVVNPSSTLFEIVDISFLKLNVTVPETQIAPIHTGQEVRIQSSIYPDTTLVGKVTFVASKADASLNFPVQVTVKNSYNYPLKAGMYATAIFSPKQDHTHPIKMISRDAFMQGLGSSQVFVVKNNKVSITNVITGRTSGTRVEILKGLDVGDIVVTSGQINLEDQSAIQVIQ